MSPRADLAPTRWSSLRAAAEFLDLTPGGLRKTLERRAARAPDGGTEAIIDGVRARKFGRVWRVQFTERWLSTSAS